MFEQGEGVKGVKKTETTNVKPCGCLTGFGDACCFSLFGFMFFDHTLFPCSCLDVCEFCITASPQERRVGGCAQLFVCVCPSQSWRCTLFPTLCKHGGEKHGWTKCWCDVSGHKSDKWNALTCGGVYKLNNFRIPPWTAKWKKEKVEISFRHVHPFCLFDVLFSERERGVSWCASMFSFTCFYPMCALYMLCIYIVHTYEIYVRRTCAFCRRVTL